LSLAKIKNRKSKIQNPSGVQTPTSYAATILQKNQTGTDTTSLSNILSYSWGDLAR